MSPSLARRMLSRPQAHGILGHRVLTLLALLHRPEHIRPLVDEFGIPFSITFARPLPVGIITEIIVTAIREINLRHQVLMIELMVSRPSALVLGNLIPAPVILIVRGYAHK